MRRGIGISGLQARQREQKEFTRVGDAVKQTNLQAMTEQMAMFKAKLEDFAMHHRSEIRQDPEFRAQFHAMCANIGVDPLASNQGVWAKTLGFGDFYYELGVQIVEACWATRDTNGGLMELSSLLTYVNRRRGRHADPISRDDVVRAIRKLKVLGSGFDVVTVGRTAYVRSVPGELNLDANRLIELAQDSVVADPLLQGSGHVSRSTVAAQPGWPAARVDAALQSVLRQGLAMVDDQSPGGERLYWFPCTAST